MKKNILFILIDNLDGKSFGPKKTSITPNIDSLIKNGTLFDQSITAAPSTCPSLCSIFTSSYPFESVIRDKKNFVLNLEMDNYIFHLKNYGYSTHAIIPESITLYRIDKIFDNVVSYPTSESVHDGIGDKIIDKLKLGNMDEPWFFYIHLVDIHGYKKFDKNEKLKKFHDDFYGKNKYEQMVSATDSWLGNILKDIDLENILIVLTADHGAEDIVFTKKLTQYRQDVRTHQPNRVTELSIKAGKNVPDFFKPIKNKFKEKYLNKRKKSLTKKADQEISVINSLDLSPYDKRIMESAAKGCYNVFDDRFMVPLIFSGQTIPNGKIIHNQVRTVDIFPTIADIIGLSTPIKKRGTSLVPLLKGNNIDEYPAFIESAANHVDSLTENVIGIRTSTFKYFRDRNNPKSNVNLYNLSNDPLEEKNIVNQFPNIVCDMEKLLLEIKNDGIFENKEQNLVDKDEAKRVEEELKKLGYI